MFANIHLNDGIELDPQLAVLVEKLALKHPSWVFRSDATVDRERTSGKYNSRWYSHPIDGGAPDVDKHYVRLVNVLQDGLAAGTIEVEISYRRRSPQRWTYELHSPRIQNGRKGDSITTCDVNTAARTVTKYFEAPSLKEMLTKAGDRAKMNLEGSFRDLERPLDRGQYCPGLVHMQVALYNLLKGVPFDERYVREKLLTEAFETALANHELATRMRAMTYRRIIAFRGQYVFFRDAAEDSDTAQPELTVAPFEELPLPWQDKLAVLQLMRDSELVLDVGYRADESTFLIAE